MLVVPLSGACQSSQDPTVDVPAGTAPTTVTTAPTTTSTSAAVRPGSTTPVSVAPSGPTATLTAVRVANQGAVDRVVFEFSDRVPGYAVRYVSRPITEDGSGNPVTVEGDAVLEVRMEPAQAHGGSDASAKGPAER